MYHWPPGARLEASSKGAMLMADNMVAVPAEILAGLQAYHRPGDVIEVRCPNAGKYKTTIAGYFDDYEAAARDVAKLSNFNHNGTGKTPAIYLTLNKIKPDLLARYYNRLEYRAKETTPDKDIISLEWLPIDIDAVRPAGISSTDQEHQAAIEKAREIKVGLISQGWPENAFIWADSGNGGHLTAKISLENSKENVELIKKCLESLDRQYSDEKCKVDLTTHNPSRIWKVPGTAVRKGDDTPTRPHRMAKILERPEALETVPREMLDALAATLPKVDATSKKSDWRADMSAACAPSFNPKQYAEAHGAHVIRVEGWTDKEGGKWELAILAECPFDPSHSRGEARIGVREDGKRTFRCFHDSCQGKDWQALRNLWEPNRKDAKAKAESTGPTVIDAIKKLAEVCDKATSKDGQGFSKFDREEHEDLIEKAISDGYLSPKEENAAYRFLKKYKKQLRGLGLAFDEIGHVSRDGEAVVDGLAEINERIPKWIAEHHFKTVSDTERLYRFDHGVYLDDGETALKTLIETEFGDVTSNRLVADVIGKVKRRTYVDRDLFNNRSILNVKNGLLNLETLQLSPHTSDFLSTAQIDVLYNQDATAPKIQKFLTEVAQAGDIALIEELIGWLLWPDYNVHKAVMFLGPGRNGKGTLLRLITAFLGTKSISNVTLQDLVADRFAKADLYGKLANIGGDLPSKDLSDTAAFRNLSGGDDNRAQEKYRPAFSFRNKAKLLFSANVLPRSPDDTYAFYSRWILIEFIKIFDLQKGTADPDLDAKLQAPEELSGLLNMALAGLARLKANGWRFSYDKTVEDVEIMYKRNANPVIAFLMDECEEDPNNYVEKGVFLSRFREYSQKHNMRPITITRFGQLLKDQSVIPLSDYRPYSPTGKALPRCWLGARFKSPSIPSIVLPTPSFPENENANEMGVKIKDREDRVYQNNGWYGRNGEIKADLLRAGEGRAATEAHNRELAKKYSGAGPTDQKSAAEGLGQGEKASKETEISIFLSALGRLLTNNPGLIQSMDGKNTSAGSVIGKWTEEGLFLLPAETLTELSKIGAFQRQPSIDSITQALSEKELLIIGRDGHLKSQIRFNGARPRGWHIRIEAITTSSKLVSSAVSTDKSGGSEGVSTSQASVSNAVSTDPPSVSSGVSTDKSGGSEGVSTSQASVSRRPEAKHSKLDPTALETVRIIKPEGYRTQIPHPENPNKFVDHLYSAGEIVEIQHWKAIDLIQRGIAEPVEASA